MLLLRNTLYPSLYHSNWFAQLYIKNYFFTIKIKSISNLQNIIKPLWAKDVTLMIRPCSDFLRRSSSKFVSKKCPAKQNEKSFMSLYIFTIGITTVHVNFSQKDSFDYNFLENSWAYNTFLIVFLGVVDILKYSILEKRVVIFSDFDLHYLPD